MSQEKSVKLAKLWVELNDVQSKLENELLPLCGYLGVEDSNLLESLENASKSIKNHLQEHNLFAERQKAATD